ncbi:MAG: hypothetical protein Q7P63_02620 [Verrucomicrobiota bacterium JB022]|nr:hypothetical protein [Verrucomicrobiota bacterium JB022]
MPLSDLRPTSLPRVYDLVKSAGLDVRDWSNYKHPDKPAGNPKYCYEWAFWSDYRVVLLLWIQDFEEDHRGIYQDLDYKEKEENGSWNSVQLRRVKRMQEALQIAWDQKLPVSVIINEGQRKEDSESGASVVDARKLDDRDWFLESYNGHGVYRLRRIEAEQRAVKLTRLVYNSLDWRCPSGDDKRESSTTYSGKNGFGHEEWLFRDEWLIDGWRYAFIQGFHKGNYQRKVFDVGLYTIEPSRTRRLVAVIYEVEGLDQDESAKALGIFQEKGWLAKMKAEVDEINGNSSAIHPHAAARDIINVRFRREKVERMSFEMEDTDWIRGRHRYMLYDIEGSDKILVERSVKRRAGSHDAPEGKAVFRKGGKPVEYTPEHFEIQRKLVDELREEFGFKAVMCEQDFVDVRVETPERRIFFEIKTDLLVKSVIRQAIGQLLEYGYHPGSPCGRADELVIVGRGAPDRTDALYLEMLQKQFRLPISYRQVKI